MTKTLDHDGSTPEQIRLREITAYVARAPRAQDHEAYQLARWLRHSVDGMLATEIKLDTQQLPAFERILRRFEDMDGERVQKEALRLTLAELVAHVAAARVAIAKLCQLTDEDAQKPLPELIAMVELEVNAEYERAEAAEAKVTEQAHQILVLQRLDRPPPEPIPRHELVRELRRVAREPDIKTTAGAFIALANILEKL